MVCCRYIHYHDVVNAIDKIKREARVTDNDASKLLKDLLERKSEDSSFAVHWELDSFSNRLTRLCWMSGDQQKLYARYHDVLQTDNTFQTNRYRMPLTLFIVVDCEGRSRIVMQGILSNETMDSYKWMLGQLLETTGLPPRVIVSDADPALLAALPLVFPDAKEVHCIFHIMGNLRKRVGPAVQSDYKMFERTFLQVRNCLSITKFEQLWNDLVAEFPQASDYLNFLYQSKKSWAKAYTSKVFTAGIQSTSRTEGYNAVLKKQITSSATL
jgi:MULE transposase domain